MGKKERRRSSLMEGEGDDHWAFLDEIEAPMWEDLALESQTTGEDIDDDPWFHTTHPIHQLSAKHLKASISRHGIEKSESPLCNSPKLPDSVSRSRGKHYTSTKWDLKKPTVQMDRAHPIRKLDGRSSKLVAGRSASGSDSNSTVSTNSSLAKPENELLKNRWSNLKLSSTLKTNTSSSNMYNNARCKPKSSFGDSKGVRSSRQVASDASCSTFNSSGVVAEVIKKGSITRGSCSGRESLKLEVNGKEFLKHCKSSSSKSSVGSSLSLGSKLESIRSSAKTKSDKITKHTMAASSVEIPRTSNSKSDCMLRGRATGNTNICDQSKAKALLTVAPRKPLSLLNAVERKSRKLAITHKETIDARKVNSRAVKKKENVSEAMVYNPKPFRCGRDTTRKGGLPNHMVKKGKDERKQIQAIPRAYFR